MDAAHPGNGPVTREKLIEAAGEIFAEKGLHGASIRDITQRAGANIAAVNYHFHDKFELYTLVLQQAHEGILAALNQVVSARTPEGRIRQLLSAMLSSALNPARPKWHTQLLGRELFQPTPALDRLQDMLQAPVQRLREAVHELRPDLCPEHTMLTVCGIVAQCLFYVHHRHIVHRLFRTLPEPTSAALADHVVAFSLAALRALPVDRRHSRPRRRSAARGAIARSTARASKRRSARSSH